MKKLLLFVILILIIAIGFYLATKDQNTDVPGSAENQDEKDEILATDPLNAIYYFEGEEFQFINGVSEKEIEPGSAAKIYTEVFGEPVTGDLDFDGDDDTVLIFTHNPGGSGTFFYLGAAIKKEKGYKGLGAIFIGDRISPEGTQIENGLVIHNYADRGLDEPMSASPSIGMSKYLILEDEELKDITAENSLARPFPGLLTIGHEVRTFQICESKEVSWIKGESKAITEIIEKVNQLMEGKEPYTPAFAILTGRIMPKETDGFGADYVNSFLAEKINRLESSQSCK